MGEGSSRGGGGGTYARSILTERGETRECGAFILSGRVKTPDRCNFPITALRVTPKTLPMTEAESPPSAIFLASSKRSSVQLLIWLQLGKAWVL